MTQISTEHIIYWILLTILALATGYGYYDRLQIRQELVSAREFSERYEKISRPMLQCRSAKQITVLKALLRLDAFTDEEKRTMSADFTACEYFNFSNPFEVK